MTKSSDINYQGGLKPNHENGIGIRNLDLPILIVTLYCLFETKDLMIDVYFNRQLYC